MNKSIFYQRMVNLFPMPQKLKDLCLKSEQFFWYIVVGGVTTLIDFFVYWFFVYFTSWCFRIQIGVFSFNITTNLIATAIAWIIAVIFSFFANKLFVFSCKNMSFRVVLRELSQFAGCRLGAFLISLLFMYVTVDLFCWNKLLMKLSSSIFDLLINFIASKFLIFRKKEPGTRLNSA